MRPTILFTVACALQAHGASAQEATTAAPRWRASTAEVELRAGVARTDNASKVSTDELSDTIYSVGLGLDYLRDGARFDVNALADIDWLEYQDDTFDGDALGYFDGAASYAFVPETFLWVARQTFGQLVSDPLRAYTPDNLENISFFSTGPDATFQFSEATRLRVFGLYSITDFQESPTDNEQLFGGLELTRKVSRDSSVGISATANRVEFDNTNLNSDYDLQTAFVSYSVQSLRTQLSADLGISRVADDGETSDGTLVRVSASRRLSASTNAFLRVRQQFSNAGNLFREGLDPTNPSDPSIGIASGEAFEERGAGLGWNLQRVRTELGIGADWSEERYERQDALDRTVLRVDGYLVRRLGPSITLRGEARWEDEEFDNAQFDDDKLTLGASIGWQIGRSYALDFRYDYADRTVSAQDGDYTENRLGIRFLYRPVRD